MSLSTADIVDEVFERLNDVPSHTVLSMHVIVKEVVAVLVDHLEVCEHGGSRRLVSIDYEAAAKAIYTGRWGPSMSGAKPGTMDYELAHAAVNAALGLPGDLENQ